MEFLNSEWSGVFNIFKWFPSVVGFVVSKPSNAVLELIPEVSRVKNGFYFILFLSLYYFGRGFGEVSSRNSVGMMSRKEVDVENGMDFHRMGK